MAQTMHLALFGPIFVAAAPPVMCFIDYHYIYTINVSWLQKNEERKKKKLTYGPNNARCFVWACFRRHRPSHCVFRRLHLYTCIHQTLVIFKKDKKEKKTHLLPKRHATYPPLLSLSTIFIAIAYH